MDKEKADCLIEMQKTLAQSRRQTRNIDFRRNISLWTLIVGATGFLYNADFRLDCPYEILTFFVIAVVVTFGHLLSMLLVQKSVDRDAFKLKMWSYYVEEWVGLSPKKPPKSFGWYWALFEAMITGLLLTAAGLFLAMNS